MPSEPNESVPLRRLVRGTSAPSASSSDRHARYPSRIGLPMPDKRESQACHCYGPPQMAAPRYGGHSQTSNANSKKPLSPHLGPAPPAPRALLERANHRIRDPLAVAVDDATEKEAWPWLRLS